MITVIINYQLSIFNYQFIKDTISISRTNALAYSGGMCQVPRVSERGQHAV